MSPAVCVGVVVAGSNNPTTPIDATTRQTSTDRMASDLAQGVAWALCAVQLPRAQRQQRPLLLADQLRRWRLGGIKEHRGGAGPWTRSSRGPGGGSSCCWGGVSVACAHSCLPLTAALTSQTLGSVVRCATCLPASQTNPPLLTLQVHDTINMRQENDQQSLGIIWYSLSRQPAVQGTP